MSRVGRQGPSSTTQPTLVPAAVGGPSHWRRRPLADYSRPAQLYWLLCMVAGATTLLLALARVLPRPGLLMLPLLLGPACAWARGRLMLRLPVLGWAIDMGDVGLLLVLLLHGTPAAVMTASVSAALVGLRGTARWSVRLANPAAAALAMGMVGSALDGLLGTQRPMAAASNGAGALALLLALPALAIARAALKSALLTGLLLLKRPAPLTVRYWAGSLGRISRGHAASALLAALVYLAVVRLGATALPAALAMLAMLLGGQRLLGEAWAQSPTGPSGPIGPFDLSVPQRDPLTTGELTASTHAPSRSSGLWPRQNWPATGPTTMASTDRGSSLPGAGPGANRPVDALLAAAFHDAAIGMLLLDADDRVLRANAAMGRLLDQPSQSMAGWPLDGCFVLGDCQRLADEIDRLRSHEATQFVLDGLRGQHRHGRELWLSVTGSLASAPAKGRADHGSRATTDRCVILQVQDITERRQADSQLRQEAWHDHLTGLPNRGRFMTLLADICAVHASGPQRFALMFMDFDRFKLINDGLGHHVGDELLRQVAARIQACLRPGDQVARLGGDEFALLMGGLDDEAPALRMADRLLAAVRTPVQALGHELVSSASIGIRLAGGQATDPTELLRDADTAMYRAKAEGLGRWSLFDTGMQARVSDQLLLEGDLRRAIAQDQIEVMFQPLVRLHDSALVGWEALARWQHASRGAIGPAQFVPLATEAGLGPALTQRVLARACAGLKTMVDAGHPPLQVHVNISATDLTQPGLPNQVAVLLQQHGLQPWQLTLELNEATLMGGQDAALDTLLALQAQGVGLCVDDFGTGSSSLALLARLPIHSLKIDARVVQQLSASAADGAQLVRAIIQLGDALGKTVIAEGIEQPEQLQQLQRLGCAMGQGYLLGRPQQQADLARPASAGPG